MVALANCRRSSNWIWMGCLIGLAVCPGCASKTPGQADCDRGRQLLDDGTPDDAVAAFKQAIVVNPQHAPAFFCRASAYQRQGKRKEAIEDLTKAIQLNKEIAGWGGVPPESRAVPLGSELAQAYFDRATLRNQAGKPDEAIADFTEVVRLDSKRADAFCGRAAAFLAKGFPEQAIDDLTEAINLDPHSHEALCQRARTWLKAGKCAEAIRDARSAIHLDAECGDAFLVLGSSISSSPNQQPDAAVKCLTEAIRLDKSLTAQANAELARAYYNMGVNLDQAGKQLEAEEAFVKAERLDPKYVVLVGEYKAKADRASNGPAGRTAVMPIGPDPRLSKLIPKASASLEAGQFDQALGEFTNILGIDPTNVDALCGRGSAFLGRNDPDSAIPDFDRAIVLAPKSPRAYCLRGQAYAIGGDYYRAISDVTEAIRLKPDYAVAYFHRAEVYWKENNFERAIANLDEAVRLDQKEPSLDSRFAAQARSLYVDICESEASKYSDARHWDMAVASLEKAISLESDRAKRLNPLLAQAHRERGFAHANHGEFEEAVRDLNKALDLDKNNAENHRLCGLTCCKMAKDCHDRGWIPDEKEQWKTAIDHMKRAIWLDPGLERELRRPLEDAQRNRAAISATASAMRPIGG